jgi:hypothetical protein
MSLFFLKRSQLFQYKDIIFVMINVSINELNQYANGLRTRNERL